MKTKHRTIRLVKMSLLTIFVCLTAFNSSAQELIFKDFKYLDGNTTARIYRHRDVNGQNCAVLIIKHNFKDFKVEAGKGYEYLEEKTGETWVWLSPDEYRIVIRKEGYIPFSYNLKDKLVSLETYELIITDEFGYIDVNAPDAQIWLDNKPVAKDTFSFILKEGKYVLKATREKYYEQEKFITVNAGDNLECNFDLKPKMGNAIFSSTSAETKGADIFIDNNLMGQKTPATIPLIIGDYSVKLLKDGYLPYTKSIFINENENTQIDAHMEIDPTILIMKHKKKKVFWLTSTIVSAGIGCFSFLTANNLYEDYQNATTDADNIRKKIQTYDKISPAAFGIASICLTEFIIHASKQGKAKRKLSLYSSFTEDSESMLTFQYTF